MRAPATPRVRVPVMLHHWRHVSFLHWWYPVDVVRGLVPPQLRVQNFDGSAWVGLVPFLMDDVRAPGVPAPPWLGRFPETNLRTYVHGPDGEGVWFHSLDAGRLLPVLTARVTYGLPYFWASMSVRRTGDEVTYRSRRRWPGPVGGRADLHVTLGDPRPEPDLSALDHFLTARHRLYSTVAGRLVVADAEHPPWPLRRAQATGVRQDLTRAAGLPDPDHEPLVHASDGVRVRVSRWRWA